MNARAEIAKVVRGGNMGILSSAHHKIEAWQTAFEPYPNIVTTPIPIKKRAKESDEPDPAATAIGKLRGFAEQCDLVKVARVLDPSATATVLDVLFVAGGRVLTTDREGRGVQTMIGELGALLEEKRGDSRAAQIDIYCTTGTARVRELAAKKSQLPESRMHVDWESGVMSLSPALIKLLSKPKRLLKILSLGVAGKGIITPESIAAIEWASIVRWLPAIAKTKEGRDCWMELSLGRHKYHYLGANTTLSQAEIAANELEEVVRGVPDALVPGIVDYHRG